MRESLTAFEKTLVDDAATVRFARALAAALPSDASGWLIGLTGELGAGKSTVARALLHALGHDGPVPSPTYTLIEPYELPTALVYHVDLYRIVDEAELEFLGISDLREGLLLAEWPERAPVLFEDADVTVAMAYSEPGRAVRVCAHSDRARALVDALDQASVSS
ncbi:MAG: tRNA (adenosine(37)-N6)-threonylcarbamoyltransferase complex ATPase subunit type 1 TsaE [Pseudomonadota bacterium]